VDGYCVDMGVSALGIYLAGANAAASVTAHASGFRENHRLFLVIKCAEKIFYMYI
jgi:hypothetical protein